MVCISWKLKCSTIGLSEIQHLSYKILLNRYIFTEIKAKTVSATMILKLVNLVCAFSVATHAHASKLGWYPPEPFHIQLTKCKI